MTLKKLLYPPVEMCADIDRMVELIGRTECLLAVSSWRASLKNGWCSPVFQDGRGEAQNQVNR